MVSSIADCVLGVARLISSARQICVKIGPRWNSKKRGGRRAFHDHVGAQDVGRHQVGRELDAGEIRGQRFRQRADQQRLAQAGNAFEQAMAADEQAGQHAVDDLVMPDDHAADLLAHGAVAAMLIASFPIAWSWIVRSCWSCPRPLAGG
jgi:hypothetical protein